MELKFDSRTDIVTAFPTQFFVFRIDEAERFNDALKDQILTKEREDTGVRRSNIGGWHSDDDLFSWPGRAVEALREVALGAIQAVVPLMVTGDCDFDVRLAGWANVSRYGAHNKRHNHRGCQISAVYYVDAGTPATSDAPESGTFEFLDPRPHAEMSALPCERVGQNMTVQPVAGRLSITNRTDRFMYHIN